MRDRSWNHLTGQQLHCFKFVPVGSSDDLANAAAPVSSHHGASADGGVPAASAMLQSHAAKQDLGDAEETGIGIALHPPAPPCLPGHLDTVACIFGIVS